MALGAFEIAALVLSLVEIFGPKARQVLEDWRREVGDNPTPAQWADLRKKIEERPPEWYDKYA